MIPKSMAIVFLPMAAIGLKSGGLENTLKIYDLGEGTDYAYTLTLFKGGLLADDRDN